MNITKRFRAKFDVTGAEITGVPVPLLAFCAYDQTPDVASENVEVGAANSVLSEYRLEFTGGSTVSARCRVKLVVTGSIQASERVAFDVLSPEALLRRRGRSALTAVSIPGNRGGLHYFIIRSGALTVATATFDIPNGSGIELRWNTFGFANFEVYAADLAASSTPTLVGSSATGVFNYA